ncbi:MAG: DNA repair protein [Clostridia bacterium]|nr:DNA repair protein [Clostridia bacterium]
MADKELRRFRRSELIEIIYELKKNEQKLQEENAELKRRLEEREVKIENVGSLAEAALALSDIFAAAEESVAIYVNEIKRRHDTLAAQADEPKKQEQGGQNNEE